ncbi:MAG: dTDP-4-dehydrorhamnose 3,5-epimerase [Steroidobacteraceae bacterium]
MKLVATDLPGVVIIEPRVFGDARGFFFESWNEKVFTDAGLPMKFVQDNHSLSSQGTLRGLHYQMRQTQGKLVRVTSGEVFDVAVDMRRNSPTFGRWVGVTLTAENKRMLWVPQGFAHGFYVTSERAEFLYKCTDFYDPGSERTLAWDDPQIGIRWPLVPGVATQLSAKDQLGKRLAEAEVFA